MIDVKMWTGARRRAAGDDGLDAHWRGRTIAAVVLAVLIIGGVVAMVLGAGDPAAAATESPQRASGSWARTDLPPSTGTVAPVTKLAASDSR